jgi:hypothetical protein
MALGLQCGRELLISVPVEVWLNCGTQGSNSVGFIVGHI